VTARAGYPRLVVKHDEPGVLPLAEFQTIEDVLVGLRERGGRATHARRLLLGALFRDRQHRSAEELAGEVQAQAPDVNISTIYRNLDELVRLGVVDRSHLGGGPAAYHLTSVTHGHLICEQCGAMTEVPGEVFRDVAETLAARYGFTANPHRFSVIGRCADCQRHTAGRLRAARIQRHRDRWPARTTARSAAGREGNRIQLPEAENSRCGLPGPIQASSLGLLQVDGSCGSMAT
jgi:Fur family transcriptional regulator, ferric uptake regulator